MRAGSELALAMVNWLVVVCVSGVEGKFTEPPEPTVVFTPATRYENCSGETAESLEPTAARPTIGTPFKSRVPMTFPTTFGVNATVKEIDSPGGNCMGV